MNWVWICVCSGAIGVMCWALLSRKWLGKKFKKWLGSRLITTVLIPLVATFPPLIVAAADAKRQPWPPYLWKEVHSWLELHPLFITVALFWPIPLILGTYLLSLVPRTDGLTAKEYGFVLHSLDDAAGEKMKRFGEATRRIATDPPQLRAGDIFQTIAQPLDQRRALVDGIYQIFRLDAESREAGSGDSISVKLAKMKNGVFDDFEAWLPADNAPHSGPAQLCSKGCSLSLAARDHQGIIVENIASELAKTKGAKYAPGALGSTSTGSIISFPVIDQPTNDVPYVVTVRSNKDSHFKENQRDRYRYLLRPFLLRISTEHSLSLLKEYNERS